MSRRQLSLFLLLPLVLCGCQPPASQTEPLMTVGDKTHAAGIYHWAESSIFDALPPLVMETVENERFRHDHSTLEMDGAVTSCFTRTTVIGEETVTVGLFRVDADGPDAVCRSETDRICTHLVNGTRPAIWHDGTVYLIGAALSPEMGNAERHYILCLRDGSTTFEKLFETTRMLNDLHLSGGILYAVSKPEFIGDTHLYYAIDPELGYSTAIETGDEIFRFGRDRILMTDDTGTYLTDSVLRSAGRCCDATQRDVGLLVEDGFWYFHRASRNGSTCSTSTST